MKSKKTNKGYEVSANGKTFRVWRDVDIWIVEQIVAEGCYLRVSAETTKADALRCIEYGIYETV